MARPFTPPMAVTNAMDAKRKAAREPGQSLGVPGNVIGQELQGHKAVQLDVLRLIDDAHSAAAEFLDDPVVRDVLADHSEDVWLGVASS